MALLDSLKNFLGGNNTSPTGGGGVQLQNIVSPGLEQVLSAVPALLGSYEEARGVPIGRVLAGLGQMGMTHGANRQAEFQKEADVSGRIQSLASQGLQPDPQTMDAIYRMSPDAADKELTDIEGRKVHEQELAQSQAYEEAKYRREHRKPFYLSPTSKEAYLPDPTGKTFGTRAPQYDKDPGAEAKSELQLFLTNRPKWNELQAAKLQYSIGGANAKVLGRANTLLNFDFDKKPFNMIPEFKGSIAIDRDTLQPVPVGTGPGSVSTRDILTNTEKYAVVDKKTGMETIPNMAAARRQVIRLAEYSAKVLPKGEAGLNTWAQTYANRWRIPFKAVSGGVNEAMFGAARTSLALQLQKAFTGSTRPVNLVEFTRITGDANPGLLTAKDIDAVIPTSRDTFEIAQQKLNVLQQLFDDKLSELNAKSGAPGYYFKSVDDAMKAAGSMPDTPEPAAPEAPTVITTPTPGSGEDL